MPASFTPPALPRPPTRTWALMTTLPAARAARNRTAAARASRRCPGDLPRRNRQALREQQGLGVCFVDLHASGHDLRRWWADRDDSPAGGPSSSTTRVTRRSREAGDPPITSAARFAHAATTSMPGGTPTVPTGWHRGSRVASTPGRRTSHTRPTKSTEWTSDRPADWLSRSSTGSPDTGPLTWSCRMVAP